MADCNSDTYLENVLADCVAIKRAGGVKATIYATRLANIAGMVVDATTGALHTLTLEASAKFLKLEGRKFRNTAGTTFARADNGPSLRTQTATFRAFVATPAQRKAVDALLDQEDLVLFVPTNGGIVKVYGYSLEGDSNGLAASGGGESDGTALADDTSFEIVFTGAETNIPPIYEETAGFPATLDYLDNLVTA